MMLTVAASLLVTVMITSAVASAGTATSGRRPLPLPRVEFRGQLEHAGYNGTIVVVAVAGKAVGWVGGLLPATCRDLQGRTSAPEDGASIDFQEYTGGAPISPGGSFAFTLRPRPQTIKYGRAPFVVKVRGTFYGNNVVGRAQGSSGKGQQYTRCTGNARFWARRWG